MEREIKFLKSNLKKKVRIFSELLVCFLITGNIFLANATPLKQDKIILNEWTVYDESVENTGTIFNLKEDANKSLEGNGVSGTNSNLNINNLGIINGKTKNAQISFNDYSGNGIYTSNNLNISNKGLLFGSYENDISKQEDLGRVFSSTATSDSGNGVLTRGIYSTDIGVINLKNLGIINGKLNAITSNLSLITSDPNKDYSGISSSFALTESGNGIFSKGKIQDNNGIIQGKTKVKTGDVEFKFEKIFLENEGRTLASSQIYSKFSGNGLDNLKKIEKNKGFIYGEGEYKTGNVTVNHKNNYDPNKTISSRITLKNSNNGIEASNIKSINNSGVILGNLIASAGKSYSESTREKVNNYNYAVDSSINLRESGNGLFSKNIENKIVNSGILSGYISVTAGEFEEKYKDYNEKGKDYVLNFFSGNGVATHEKIENITNNGIVKGSTSAIVAKNINNISNFGILAGREIFSNGKEIIKNDTTKYDYQIDFEDGSKRDLETIIPKTEDNKGIYIKLASEKENGKNTGNVEVDGNGNAIIEKIEIGTGGEATLEDGSKKTVINGSENGELSTVKNTITGNKDIYVLSSKLNNTSNIIVNGTGMKEGALVVDKDISLKDSTINGYNSAVYLENDKTLNGDNSIFNGGGLKGEVTVIKGGDGANTVNLTNNSIINGKIDLGNGNDKLSLDNSTQINGELLGGEGKDTLDLGTKGNNSELRILHNISGFENLNTNGDVTLFETTKVTGVENIDIQSGNLNLRVDPTVKDDNGRITGHALYGNNNGKLTTTGGKLVIGLNGLGKDGIVSMKGIEVDKKVDDLWWKDTDKLTTNSLVLDATLLKDGDILIKVKESLDLIPGNPINPPGPVDPPTLGPVDPPAGNVDSLYYKKLNKMYQSIISAEEIGKLQNTTSLDGKTKEEALGNLLTILSHMYANNPYSYMLKGSKDSMNLFEDNLSYLTIKPQKDEYIAQGKAIFSGVKRDNVMKGKNYYGFDVGQNNYKTTSSINGGIATLEYGLSDKTSAGIVIGGNNQNVKYSSGGKIDADSMYIGSFIKTDVDKFKFMTGIGYQYTSANATRSAVNNYDSFTTGANYDVNSLNAFLEAKYSYDKIENYKLEPKIRLSYYHTEQDKINEGYTPNKITMKTDKYDNDLLNLEVGVDLVKESYLKEGKLRNIVSLGVENTIGNKSKELRGNIIGKDRVGSQMDIYGVEIPTVTGKASYNLEYEKENGWIYTVGADVEFGKHSNISTTGTIGIGYKFGSFNELFSRKPSSPKVVKPIATKVKEIRLENYYEFDKTTINFQGKEVIKNMAKRIDNQELKGTMIIEGHTDSLGKENYNQKLSEKRAEEVKKEFDKNLVKKENVKYEVKGYGETKPIADNKTEEGRAKNRRVHVKFIND